MKYLNTSRENLECSESYFHTKGYFGPGISLTNELTTLLSRILRGTEALMWKTNSKYIPGFNNKYLFRAVNTAGKPSTSCNRFQASSMLENMAKAQVVSYLSNAYLRKQNKDKHCPWNISFHSFCSPKKSIACSLKSLANLFNWGV